MSGAQAKASVIAGCIGVIAEVCGVCVCVVCVCGVCVVCVCVCVCVVCVCACVVAVNRMSCFHAIMYIDHQKLHSNYSQCTHNAMNTKMW